MSQQAPALRRRSSAEVEARSFLTNHPLPSVAPPPTGIRSSLRVPPGPPDTRPPPAPRHPGSRGSPRITRRRSKPHRPSGSNAFSVAYPRPANRGADRCPRRTGMRQTGLAARRRGRRCTRVRGDPRERSGRAGITRDLRGPIRDTFPVTPPSPPRSMTDSRIRFLDLQLVSGLLA